MMFPVSPNHLSLLSGPQSNFYRKGAAPAPVIPGHAKRVMLIAAFLLIWCLYARAAMQDGFIYLYRIRIF